MGLIVEGKRPCTKQAAGEVGGEQKLFLGLPKQIQRESETEVKEHTTIKDSRKQWKLLWVAILIER